MGEALVASVDDCKHHAATAVLGHMMKLLVPAAIGPKFGSVGQEKDRSFQHLAVSVAVEVWVADIA